MSAIPGFSAANHSWSASRKDYNADGRVSREEFMAPIPVGETGLVEVRFAEIPKDLEGIVTEESQKRAGTQESLEDQFTKFDRNQDGSLDSSEIGEVTTSAFVQGKTYLQDLAKYGSPEAVADAYSQAAKASALLNLGSSSLDVKA